MEVRVSTAEKRLEEVNKERGKGHQFFLGGGRRGAEMELKSV